MPKRFFKDLRMRLFIAFWLLSSTFLFAQDIEINSTVVGADIFVASDANVVPVKIGVTPFKMPLNELINTYVQKNTFHIILKKDGYDDYSVLFTKTSDVDVALTVNMKVDDKIKKIKDYDVMMSKLFDVQKLIRGGNIADAINQLDNLEKEHRGFSIIAELKATAYYMQKDVEKALSYYRKAFAENENNKDAYRMKVYLEKKLGVYSDI